MYRHNKKIKVGLRFKLIFALIVTVIVAELGIYAIVSMEVSKKMENQIKKDVKELKSNTEVYVKQILILNFANNDEESFKEYAEEIIQELYGAGRRHVALYGTDGTLIRASSEELFQHKDLRDDDLHHAMQQKSTFIMQYTDTGGLDVYFSMPVSVEARYIGIARYYMDYTEARIEAERIGLLVTRISAIVFLAIFVTIIFVLNKIVHPIRKLAKISNQVTRDMEKGQLDEKHYLELKWSKKKDEVGELTNNYKLMLKTVEEQLEKLQDDKEEIYRLMESKKSFYDNVTHELKTPLTTITGYAQLLESNGKEDAVLFEKGIQVIQEESKRLHKMVIQLLEMADYERKQEKSPILLEQIIQSVAESMEMKAKRYENHIVTKVEEGLLIMGEADKIRQVLINIIDNAIKYGAEREEISILGKSEQEQVVIQITNKGKGLNQEEIDHIFEAFYRVDKEYSRERGSAGLGLSICNQIVEQHGGTITVQSVVNKETTFSLYFPKMNYQEGKRGKE